MKNTNTIITTLTYEYKDHEMDRQLDTRVAIGHILEMYNERVMGDVEPSMCDLDHTITFCIDGTYAHTLDNASRLLRTLARLVHIQRD